MLKRVTIIILELINYFITDNLSSESYVGSFSTFSKKMEGTLDKLVKQNEDYAGKMTGGNYYVIM